jgi:putative Mn2+ efflux pump MntP
VLKLILFVLPLGLDTFAVSAALGVQGLRPRDRLRASLLMSSFEMAMPIVGLLIGHGLGAAIGAIADYLAAAALIALGVWMLAADEQDEPEKLAAFANYGGLALIGLGISISLDELAIGFAIGLLHLSIALAIALIGIQAFLVAQIGLRLGAHLGATARERAEKLAGLALAGLGAFILIQKIVGST